MIQPPHQPPRSRRAPSRVASARRWALRQRRLVLATVLGTCLASVSVAYARSAGDGSRTGASTRVASPLSVTNISARIARGRITGAATIVNHGDLRARSTTGVLALARSAQGEATGVVSFRIRALAVGRSTRVRFTSRRLDALPVTAGGERVLVCADVDSQLGRFSRARNCSAGATLPPSGAARARPSGPAPDTTIENRLPRSGTRSSAALRFASSLAGSSFQCRLDGGPWLACRSPRRYRGLAAGAHTFDVRAISPSGRRDGTPAQASWTTRATAPKVTLTSPASGSTAATATPTFSGAAGAGPGASPTVEVQLFSGSGTTGSAVQTLSARRSGGVWSVTSSQPLANGTYTARAEQSSATGATGVSAPSTFRIATTTAPPLNQDPTSSSATTPTVTTTTTATTTVPVTTTATDTVTNTETDTVTTTATATDTVTTTATGTTTASSPTQGEDDFNRPDGQLGADDDWTAAVDGGLSIASDQVVGRAGDTTAGDIRTEGGYSSDQYSQIELTSSQLTGGDWVGPSVRNQDDGQEMYLGIYWWNNGDPELELFERTGGTFVQLGQSDPIDALPAGTEITVSAVGSQISLQVDGVEKISVTDTTLTGGSPGLMMFGPATADNWSGGTASAAPTAAPLDISYAGTDDDGIASYDFTSGDDGYGTHVVRVLQPTDPAPGVPHNFLYVLPVEPELGTTYGDGMQTMYDLNAQNEYNLTIIEPSFADDPWYADNPGDVSLQYESFITQQLVPWVTQNFSDSALSSTTQPLTPTSPEQNWLIGFSKSGIGAQDLLLKHPDDFAVAASWDFPADMSSYDQFGTSSADNYGTEANFQDNYQLTPDFLDAHGAPFTDANRIWIGGYNTFESDIADYDSLLTSEGIEHTTETPQEMDHSWDSGWVPIALGALSQQSAALSVTP